MNRKILFIILLLVPGIAVFTSLWFLSGRMLYPPWKTADLTEQPPEYWGEENGNLRFNKKFVFNDVTVESENGRLSGWHVPYHLNRGRSAVESKTALFFLHGAGTDRRQGFRYLEYFLDRGCDVYLFDLSGHGESSGAPGISMGIREHKDAIAIYRFLRGKYTSVIAMGTSMGATSLLIALDQLKGIDAVIAENPFYSPERFIEEIPALAPFPRWYKVLLLKMICFRGGFDDICSSAQGVASQSGIPVLFIHSKKDNLIPYRQSVDLHRIYRGPKKLLITEEGGHTVIWDSERELYEDTLDDFLDELPVQVKI